MTIKQDELIRRLVHALQWCGGSTDFHHGGTAYSGWQTVVRPALEEGESFLGIIHNPLPEDEDAAE